MVGPRRPALAQRLAGRVILGLRRGRPWSRRRLWTGFLDALRQVDPDMAVNIEHEDQELDQMEGLRYAAETLLQAARRITDGSTEDVS